MFSIENCTEAERALLLDLLEREHNDLPVEIRHTRNSVMRGELHERAVLVQRLIDHMRAPAEV
jgi:hypothetical protein